MPDECTWTLGDGAACLTLEKAERKVWDYLLSQPPAPPLPPSDASAASSAVASSSSPADLAAAAAPYLGVDISEVDDRAAQVTATLSGLAVAEPSAAARLMCAAASSHVAPPKPPPPVATGPTEQAAPSPRTGGDTIMGAGRENKYHYIVSKWRVALKLVECVYKAVTVTTLCLFSARPLPTHADAFTTRTGALEGYA